MTKSNTEGRSCKAVNKPPKPYKDFPLTPHNGGSWMKKVRGRIHYFGRWAKTVDGKMERLPDDGWQEALTLYKAQADDLHAGRTPRVKSLSPDGLTVAALCNAFLTKKTRLLKSGEITAQTFAEYKSTTDRLVQQFGKDRLVDDLAADDFAALRASIAEQWGPVRLSNEITRCRSVFKHAIDNGLTMQAIRYGSEFDKPSKAVLRKVKAAKGPKTLTAEECRTLIDAARPVLKAMIYLGLNCGYGNKDCAMLPESVIDLDTGWADFPRPKSGVARRCPLWPETAQALREAIAARPEPKLDKNRGLMFLTARGRQWLTPDGTSAWPVTAAIGKLMKAVGVHREGIGFYSLRHTHRTIADRSLDPVACNLLMGHSDSSMAATYTHGIDDSRLVAVADHVRQWLFGDNAPTDRHEQPESTIEAPTRESIADDAPTLKLYAG